MKNNFKINKWQANHNLKAWIRLCPILVNSSQWCRSRQVWVPFHSRIKHKWCQEDHSAYLLDRLLQASQCKGSPHTAQAIQESHLREADLPWIFLLLDSTQMEVPMDLEVPTLKMVQFTPKLLGLLSIQWDVSKTSLMIMIQPFKPNFLAHYPLRHNTGA